MTNDKFTQIYVIVKEVCANLKLRNNALSLDDVDVEILKTLQEDSRQSYTAIGKRLHIAHSTVFDRMRKMEHEAVIRGYTTLVDLEKVGLKSITAMMTVYTEPKATEKVALKLAEYPETVEVYTSLSDELLVMAKVIAESQEALHAFVANSVAPLSGVLRIRTSIVTKKLKETGVSTANYTKGLHL